ncbi:protein CREG1-like [Stomoxys calcitrans]|uniref:CREG-like beta-barrel domain-containing protein n=1 Tax=Stomoxys calcitrans TaxID=35570 RepID=A0A1I8NLQ7_STOCA|nr:protein CREG1-like [Stomoxys calcitrans]
MLSKTLNLTTILLSLYLNVSLGYHKELNHALVARTLVHQTNWAAIGSISTLPDLKHYPMVNVVSINDVNAQHQSTGRIQFLLTNVDYTGQDVEENNKVTLLFSDEQLLHCSLQNIDPLEPICARAIISGEVKWLDQNDKYYLDSLGSFFERHPASKRWLHYHNFYLCELEITNIAVVDYYGGVHNVKPSDYYNILLNDKVILNNH